MFDLSRLYPRRSIVVEFESVPGCRFALGLFLVWGCGHRCRERTVAEEAAERPGRGGDLPMPCIAVGSLATIGPRTLQCRDTMPGRSTSGGGLVSHRQGGNPRPGFSRMEVSPGLGSRPVPELGSRRSVIQRRRSFELVGYGGRTLP